MNIVAERRIAEMINFVLGFLSVCVLLMIPTMLLLMRTIDSLNERIKTLTIENKLLRDVRTGTLKKKPRHKSKLILFVNVETSYDQKPESKASLLLNTARMLDKNYILEVIEMGPVEEIEENFKKV